MARPDPDGPRDPAPSGSPGEPLACPDREEQDSRSLKGTTVSGLARMAGVHRSTVQQWTKSPDFPPVMADGSINAFAVGVWHRDKQVTKAATQAMGGDPLLATGDSPALEAYRWQKAILAGFDVEERRRSIIRVDDANEVFAEVARVLRQSHETVQRQFGPEAHEILEDALREAAILINARFGSLPDDDVADGSTDPESDAQ